MYYYLTSKGVNLKVFPSKRPLSLNFKEGITSKAIKDYDINGAFKVLPISLAKASNTA